MTREELRRAIERPARRAGLDRRAGAGRRAAGRRRGRAGRAAAALDDAARALGPARRPAVATGRLRAQRRRPGRGRAARRGRLRRARPRAAAPRRAGCSCASATRTRAARSCAAGSRSTSRTTDVVARLTERRLLTVSEGTVEVAHEALLQEWPRLRGWLDEDTEGRRLQHRLREAAGAWEADRRDPGGLYRGARLAAALDWAAEHGDELDATERAFLEAGRRASGRAQRRLRAGLAGVASLLVLAVIAGVVALDQRNQARERETAADAQRLGAQALASDDLDLALLLARQGVALNDTVADARQPARRAAQEPGGDRRHPGRRPAREPRPQPRRPDARDDGERAGGFTSSTRARDAPPCRPGASSTNCGAARRWCSIARARASRSARTTRTSSTLRSGRELARLDTVGLDLQHGVLGRRARARHAPRNPERGEPR